MKKTIILMMALCAVVSTQAQFKINKDVVKAGAKVAKAATISDAEINRYAKEYIDWSDKENPICKGDKYAKRVEALTKGLENHDGLKLNFKVYKTDNVNAFACADGSIRIYAGLLEVMTDEEVLGVIGHEIGHVKNKDIKDAFRTALLTSALRDAAGSQGGKAAALNSSQLGGLSEALANAQFSQKQERAADDYGYEFLKKAGKNPWAMALSFERLSALVKEYGGGEESKIEQLMSTHPDTDKRAKRMSDKAKKDGFERPENKKTVATPAKKAPAKKKK